MPNSLHAVVPKENLHPCNHLESDVDTSSFDMDRYIDPETDTYQELFESIKILEQQAKHTEELLLAALGNKHVLKSKRKVKEALLHVKLEVYKTVNAVNNYEKSIDSIDFIDWGPLEYDKGPFLESIIAFKRGFFETFNFDPDLHIRFYKRYPLGKTHSKIQLHTDSEIFTQKCSSIKDAEMFHLCLKNIAIQYFQALQGNNTPAAK
jgi:hypothetical protein